ncbi:MAG: hypothetical protein WBA57_14230 [Elainellaceae cyanobacterium]
MTPYEIELADQHRLDQQEAIALSLYQDGLTDGSNGDKARQVDVDYLAGYCDGLKRLPLKDGQIQYPDPGQHFAFGYVDSPDEGVWHEF